MPIKIPTVPPQLPQNNARFHVLLDTIKLFETYRDDYLRTAEQNHQNWRSDNSAALKKVRVVEGDWGDVTLGASKTNGHIYAVLNMANAYHPGGGYLEGMVAQEENMFRRTDCHFWISPDQTDEEGIYKPPMTALINGNLDSEAPRVYLDDHPRVCIKGRENLEQGNVTGYELLTEKDFFLFYELRSAADDLRPPKTAPSYPQYLPFNADRTRKKIRAQLETLKDHGIRHVVLSAFGCGAFGNPAADIARIYKEELIECAGYFDEVIFAIYYAGYGPRDNFQSFHSVLHDLSLSPVIDPITSHLKSLHQELQTDVWNQYGYGLPFFCCKKVPTGIQRLRAVLNSDNTTASKKFLLIKQIAIERLQNPPRFTMRHTEVQKLYEYIHQMNEHSIVTAERGKDDAREMPFV